MRPIPVRALRAGEPCHWAIVDDADAARQAFEIKHLPPAVGGGR